jgi:hypothetical protein
MYLLSDSAINHQFRTYMPNWLRRPYPFSKDFGSALKTALISGLFIWLFLYFFRPFGTQIPEGREAYYFGICFLFGLVTTFAGLLTFGITRLFPRIFTEEDWTVSKEILFNIGFISIIGLGNFFLAHYLFDVPLTAGMLLQWQAVTFAVGMIPATIGAFYGQAKYARRYVEEAQKISQQINRQPESNFSISENTTSNVLLKGENQNEDLHLSAAQIAYLAAADNYVQVFYWENEILKSRLLRSTMRKMEDAFQGHPSFLRCHRTYIVNLVQVYEVSGNAQGYRLHLRNIAETVPVSRNLNDVVRERLRKEKT